ncbi:MAG: DUF4031 domain-containing protein [Verrucomicrobia bacterium]|nr:DUF4031 domain-containing protein [Verrucomicrobiota bacterium]
MTGDKQKTPPHRPRNDRPDPAVYVDGLFVFKSRNRQARHAGQSNGHSWCHMWSDDLQALHAMARNLGMRRKWFQNRPGFPHYDLPPFRRAAALSLGAIERSLKNWLRAKRPPQAPRKSPATHPAKTESRPGNSGRP